MYEANYAGTCSKCVNLVQKLKTSLSNLPHPQEENPTIMSVDAEKSLDKT